MNDYNKKSDFQKRPFELFQATCAACGKTCEVPFRPNGKKPVYCKECFAKNGGPAADSRGPSDRFAPRRDFSPRPSYNKPDFHNDAAPAGDRGMGELTRQIESMNLKLDKLVYLLTPKAPASKEGDAAPKKKFSLKKKK